MRDRTPTKVLGNGALRYGVYDADGTFLRYEYLGLDDQPTQEGTPLNKASLLTDGVCEILGLDHDATPNDAFLALCLPSGKYAVSVTVKSPGGRPIPNVTLSGLLTAAGNPVVTGTDGVGFGFATTSPVTVTADISAFLDLTGTASVTVTPTAGVVNKAEITCTRASSAQTTISTSRTVRFSPDVSEYDFSAIGGGHNGGKGTGYGVNSGQNTGASATGGKGGDAGGIINKSGVPNQGSDISVIVGAAGGISKVGDNSTPASGAKGGSGASASSFAVSGDSSSNATAGGNTSGFLYPPTTVGGAGGGGYANAYGENYITASSASGGSPYGGDGAENGKGPGAGGGGQGVTYSRSSSPSTTGVGAGQPGLVGFMWRYAA